MSHGPRRGEIDERPRWYPSADFATLRRRAAIYALIRDYFAREQVLEVHTPLLMPWGAPDPALMSFFAQPHDSTAHREPVGFLQTSPEFAMKRLLAAGSGDIYQVCPAFRAEEAGRHHLCEFTLLEWYRVGMTHHQLMGDVECLLHGLSLGLEIKRKSFQALIEQFCACDPHTSSTSSLAARVGERGVELGDAARDRQTVLDALYTLALRPRSPREAIFVYDFPVEHSAYARIAPGTPPRAQRFELIIDGVELANGYAEVTDRAEQERRWHQENQRRRQLGRPSIAPDPMLLAALDAGLPPCAGVALGLDRLVMLCTERALLREVVSFDPYGAGPVRH